MNTEIDKLSFLERLFLSLLGFVFLLCAIGFSVQNRDSSAIASNSAAPFLSMTFGVAGVIFLYFAAMGKRNRHLKVGAHGFEIALSDVAEIKRSSTPRDVAKQEAEQIENPNEATAKSFHHGWYFTGDTATIDEDGYFWFVGRSDDVITSSGYRISPFEVESTLLEHPAVAESAVVGVPDEIRTELVKAYIVLAEGYSGDDAMKKEIQTFVKTNTAPYKYPREIEFRESLPKTISGKIRRVELRAE